ncbi:MAG: dockerin type I domain-containing protein [Planctomycetota bacterium]|jgi:hypothetical protein
MNPAKAVILCGTLLIATSGAAHASSSPLLPADGSSGDNFGCAVALAGNVAIVGAPGVNDHGSDAGAAYIFRQTANGWSQEAKLLADDGAAGDEFGIAVDVFGDVAIVGAWMADDGAPLAGAAYVFAWDGTSWEQQAKLTAPDEDVVTGGLFGGAVAVGPQTIAVGTMGDATHGLYAGAVHVFRTDPDGGAWTHAQKLTASDGEALDYLGTSVAIHDGLIVAGAYGDDDRGSLAGAAYVFAHDFVSWGEAAKLVAADGSDGDKFGHAVDVFDGMVVVGAPEDSDLFTDGGAAYVFQHGDGAWSAQSKLVPKDGAVYDKFGSTVAASEDRVAVGAPFHDANLPDAGAAYLFAELEDEWVQSSRIISPTAYYLDNFGSGIALEGNRVLVGAEHDDDNGNNSGSSFVFSGCVGDVNGDGMVDANDLLVVRDYFGLPCEGCPADIDGDGNVTFADVALVISNWGACP